MSERQKPRQILLSKRANIFYLEHVRVQQKDERVVYLTDTGDDIDRFFNIPERNTALILLGKGSSITDAAARRLAESNVLLGFCGSGGSPLFSLTEPVFLSPQSEYRPTEYMQAWVRHWFDEPSRQALARSLLHERIRHCQHHWQADAELRARQLLPPETAIARFQAGIEAANTSQDLLLAEAEWAKQLYATLARGYKLEFRREEGKGSQDSKADRVNSFLDHGNYLAYGLAAVALNGLGISFSFPLLHGKTRRGALVFDIADLIKDALVMPHAFACGTDRHCSDKDFRSQLIEHFHKADTLDFLFGFVKSLCEKSPQNQGDKPTPEKRSPSTESQGKPLKGKEE
ncbi:type I-F CRISPR-associated endonuclease Cas1f [Parachitinimonas caeni]|uniref:CRISPR-associated endonuclease Cas1 n=1 Tax=Parachitinimonas caeni TaxID=3031301 RepID=A0ABT7E569_9NEIS|nr:type I-F CRISPR-associated endonuclease Cas1f [Parachitinimonas caeni]MDK2126595.1 type I-F CRISPR-associated endonuclease Cas1f [Parachitinimonas caeni]